MKKVFAVLGILASCVLSAGCETNNGNALSGRWIEKTETTGVKHPRVLVIAEDEGVYRVDEDIYVNGEYKTQREIAQPVSKTVISVKGGLRSIRLENGVIFYRNVLFVKAT